MITLSCLVNPRGSLALSGSYSIGYGVQHELEVGHIAVSPIQDVLDPTRTTEDIPFGFLWQGRQVKGRLHDKDVYHVNAKGSLTVDPRLLQPREIFYVTDSNPAWGIPMVDAAGRHRRIVDIAYWGTDLVEELSLDVPLEFSSYYGWIEPHQRVIRQEIRFHGDNAIHIFWIDKFSWRTVGSEEYTNVLDMAFLRFLKRDGSLVYMSSTISSGHDDMHRLVFNLPTGPVLAEHLVLEPSVYGIQCSIQTDMFEPEYVYDAAATETVAEFVRSNLRSPNLLARVSKTFASSPVLADWGSLGLSCQNQMKYVKRDVILTVTDFASRGLGMVGNWDKLVQVFRTLLANGIKAGTWFHALMSAKSWAKFFADLHLTVQYADLPLIGDVKEVARAWGSFVGGFRPSTRLHSRCTSVEPGALRNPIYSTAVLTVEADTLPSGFWGDAMRMITGLKKWGVYPSLPALWDLVPFSFVVDWFLNFGNLFQQTQDALDQDCQYFPVQYSILGVKRLWRPELSQVMPGFTGANDPSYGDHQLLFTPGVSGRIEFSLYDRYMISGIPLPIPELEWGSGLSPLRWTQALSLVVQRLK